MLEAKVNENGMYNELIKLGMNKILASDLAARFYHNELTVKDLEIVKLELKGFVKDEINKLDKRIDKLDSKFNLLYWALGFILSFQVVMFFRIFNIFFK